MEKTARFAGTIPQKRIRNLWVVFGFPEDGEEKRSKKCQKIGSVATAWPFPS